MPKDAPCTLRLDQATTTKGNVSAEAPAPSNKYNQNFQNKFCGCECDYDAHQQKGTMFQCLGLGTADQGGCGEDWWHPSCIVGLGPQWLDNQMVTAKKIKKNESGSLLSSVTEVAPAVVESREGGNSESSGGLLDTIVHVASAVVADRDEASSEEDLDEEELPLPPGFPAEDDFDGFICYKCVDSNPWIKKYAGAPGFLAPVFKRSAAPSPEAGAAIKEDSETLSEIVANGRKRKASEEADSEAEKDAKRAKDSHTDIGISSAPTTAATAQNDNDNSNCRYKFLPTPPSEPVSLFFKSDFREHLCRCADCFPRLAKHSQLLEEEDTYEPPISESNEDAASTVGSGSIYDRGESALKNVDRVKAIEGVMAYNHLKDKLTPFFKEFAESGKAISAEDIKAHFAKMRGDEEAIKKAGEDAAGSTDNRREQSGY